MLNDRVKTFILTLDRDGYRRVEKFLQESVLIAFDLLWKVLLPDRNFATLLDPPLSDVRSRGLER